MIDFEVALQVGEARQRQASREFLYGIGYVTFDLRKYRALAVGKRRSQLESRVTDQSGAKHSPLHFSFRRPFGGKCVI